MERISRFDSHHRLFWSVAAGIIGYLALGGSLAPSMRLVAGWDFFAVADLLLVGAVFVHENPAEVRRTVRLQDSGRTLIFILVVLASCVSLGAVGFLLGGIRNLPGGEKFGHVLLTLATVILSWLVMHTVFAVRYAHMYYRQERADGGSRPAAGLLFPEEPKPDYFDFEYFSLVIGMTCQVSDVQVTSRRIRQLVLLHGVIAFAFNTIVLALSINILSGLFS